MKTGLGLLLGCVVMVALICRLTAVHPVLNVGQSLDGFVYLCEEHPVADVIPVGAIVQYTPPARVQAEIRRVAPHADLHLPWLKRIAARGGDEVCWREGRLVVNGGASVPLTLLRDYALTVPTGCVQLGTEEVLPLGTNGRSFDGRYTGTLRLAEVSQICIPLF